MSAHSRTFRFQAGAYNGGRQAISCDGLVPGAALDLSHWEGNRTPAQFKADTSTEIAINFIRSGEAAERWADAEVVNNHFDTDGALSAWVLLDPEQALHFADLLIAAAEAGDFDEWPKLGRGLQLDAALRALAAEASSDEDAYAIVLPRVAELLVGLDDRRDLWGGEWDALQHAVHAVDDGRIRLELLGCVGLVLHGVDQPELPGPIAAREFLPGARRYLLAFAERDGRFTYRYERPHYAWADTVVRPPIAAPDAGPLLEALGGDWTDEDLPGMTGIIRTRHAIETKPHAVLETLQRLDK